MKAIVGIDEAGAYRPAIQLLGRIQFDHPAVLLLHAADVNLSVPGQGAIAPEAKEHYARTVQNLGLAALDEARLLACEHDLHAKSKFVFGQAAGTLIAEADAFQADLVAVRASHQGVWSTSFLGSVSRALAIHCHSNVLIAKGQVEMTRPFRVLFATDHSPYAQASLTRFTELKGRGIDEVHVVSAYEVDDNEAKSLRLNLPMLGGDIERYLEDIVEGCNQACCAKLTAAGYATSSTVIKGHPNDAIRQAMQNTHSDLLVVGAQGTDCLPNVLIGSTALHQVVAEPYPVLVMRPKF